MDFGLIANSINTFLRLYQLMDVQNLHQMATIVPNLVPVKKRVDVVVAREEEGRTSISFDHQTIKYDNNHVLWDRMVYCKALDLMVKTVPLGSILDYQTLALPIELADHKAFLFVHRNLKFLRIRTVCPPQYRYNFLKLPFSLRELLNQMTSKMQNFESPLQVFHDYTSFGKVILDWIVRQPPPTDDSMPGFRFYVDRMETLMELLTENIPYLTDHDFRVSFHFEVCNNENEIDRTQITRILQGKFVPVAFVRSPTSIQISYHNDVWYHWKFTKPPSGRLPPTALSRLNHEERVFLKQL